jgi:hypothetical protein
MIALGCLAMLVWPRIVVNERDDDVSNHDRSLLP